MLATITIPEHGQERARHGCREVKTANLRGNTSCWFGQWSELTVTRAAILL